MPATRRIRKRPTSRSKSNGSSRKSKSPKAKRTPPKRVSFAKKSKSKSPPPGRRMSTRTRKSPKRFVPVGPEEKQIMRLERRLRGLENATKQIQREKMKLEMEMLNKRADSLIFGSRSPVGTRTLESKFRRVFGESLRTPQSRSIEAQKRLLKVLGAPPAPRTRSKSRSKSARSMSDDPDFVPNNLRKSKRRVAKKN